MASAGADTVFFLGGGLEIATGQQIFGKPRGNKRSACSPEMLLKDHAVLKCKSNAVLAPQNMTECSLPTAKRIIGQLEVVGSRLILRYSPVESESIAVRVLGRRTENGL